MFNTTRSFKYIIFDLTIFINSLIFSFIIFHYRNILQGFKAVNPLVLLFFMVTYGLVFLLSGIYKTLWEYTNFDDILKLYKAGAAAALIMVAAAIFLFP
ncbi:MAG TPA: hypothetical protein VKS21_08535, partial [Spirochaetota bacterium]|nr:hypothetical protein [Spirochaetota bacterium]